MRARAEYTRVRETPRPPARLFAQEQVAQPACGTICHSYQYEIYGGRCCCTGSSSVTSSTSSAAGLSLVKPGRACGDFSTKKGQQARIPPPNLQPPPLPPPHAAKKRTPLTRDDQATRYCEEVKSSREGWRLALEVFRVTARPEARFFSLGCLQDALGARAGAVVRVDSQHDRYVIRDAVMGWLKAGGGAELESQETFIRTKV